MRLENNTSGLEFYLANQKRQLDKLIKFIFWTPTNFLFQPKPHESNMSSVKRRKVDSEVPSILKKKKQVIAPVEESTSGSSPEPAAKTTAESEAEAAKDQAAKKSFKDLV